MCLARRAIFLFILALFLVQPAFAADVPGSKDHPLLPRLPHYTIGDFQQVAFGAHDFMDPEGNDVRVEGRFTKIEYNLDEGIQPPGDLHVIANYEQAIKGVGGQAYRHSDYLAFLVLKKDGAETWVRVNSQGDGETYWLTFVEKGEVEQQVKAGEMLQALKTKGRISLSIHFDTGKATIKPESRPVVEEIAKMLKEDSALKIKVEGHTDSIGEAAANQELSEKRAKAVAEALATLGVDPGRLSPAGFGESRPVAENGTEAGRAKNRRVDLVKL